MTEIRTSNCWPFLLIFLGLLFLGLTGWSVHRSVTGVSEVTHRDYYSHGLRYNATLLEKAAAESLGWEIGLSLQKGFLVSRWSSRNGEPISGGEARLVIPDGNRPDITVPLTEEAPGRYGARLPAGLRGEISAMLTFSHGGATLRRPLLLNI